MLDQNEKLYSEDFNPLDRSQLIPNKESQFITKIDRPIVFKLVKFTKEKPYILMDYFTHKVGLSEKDTRSHVCQKSIGNDVSPEKDLFYNTKTKLNELKNELRETGNQSLNLEIAKLESIVKKFKPTQRGWLCVITPGNPKLQALKVPKGVIDDIFGVSEKQSSEYRPARKGVLQEMLEEGRSPFSPTNTGWLVLTKTGQGINTKYTVKEHTTKNTEMVGNKKITSEVVQEETLNPVIKNLSTNDIPNVYEFERKWAFKPEEAQVFADSLGAVVPERLLKSGDNSMAAHSEPKGLFEDNTMTSMMASQGLSEDDFKTDALPF